MKNLFKSLITFLAILFSIFSVVGILFAGVFYLASKNKKLKSHLDEFKEDFDEKKLEFEEKQLPVLSEKISQIIEDARSEVRKFEKSKKTKRDSKVKTAKLKVDNSKLNKRQKELLNVFQVKKRSEMKDLSKKFPSVTQRTLRRDLSKLEEMGYVKQKGSTRNSIYTLMV